MGALTFSRSILSWRKMYFWIPWNQRNMLRTDQMKLLFIPQKGQKQPFFTFLPLISASATLLGFFTVSTFLLTSRHHIGKNQVFLESRHPYISTEQSRDSFLHQEVSQNVTVKQTFFWRYVPVDFAEKQFSEWWLGQMCVKQVYLVCQALKVMLFFYFGLKWYFWRIFCALDFVKPQGQF